MQQDTIWTVLITLIGVLGGGSAWRYYEKRAMRKERDDEFIRHDCKDRIAKLEVLLENSLNKWQLLQLKLNFYKKKIMS
jgi:hypothetical protein